MKAMSFLNEDRSLNAQMSPKWQKEMFITETPDPDSDEVLYEIKFLTIQNIIDQAEQEDSGDESEGQEDGGKRQMKKRIDEINFLGKSQYEQ